MLVSFEGARMILLPISPVSGAAAMTVGGLSKRTQEFLVEVDVGGLTGAMATLMC